MHKLIQQWFTKRQICADTEIKKPNPNERRKWRLICPQATSESNDLSLPRRLSQKRVPPFTIQPWKIWQDWHRTTTPLVPVKILTVRICSSPRKHSERRLLNPAVANSLRPQVLESRCSEALKMKNVSRRTQPHICMASSIHVSHRSLNVLQKKKRGLRKHAAITWMEEVALRWKWSSRRVYLNTSASMHSPKWTDPRLRQQF